MILMYFNLLYRDVMILTMGPFLVIHGIDGEVKTFREPTSLHLSDEFDMTLANSKILTKYYCS